MVTQSIPTNSTAQRSHSVVTLLKFTFTLVPIAAGADKFLNILTDWSKYLDSSIVSFLPFNAHVFMMIVGVIEIAAGIIVFVKTELGAYIVAGWLLCIAVTLLISGNYLDVAVRDIVMAVSAFSLAKMSGTNNSQ
jgi:hypothetical protein